MACLTNYLARHYNMNMRIQSYFVKCGNFKKKITSISNDKAVSGVLKELLSLEDVTFGMLTYVSTKSFNDSKTAVYYLTESKLNEIESAVHNSIGQVP